MSDSEAQQPQAEAAGRPAAALPVYTAVDVARHAAPDDAWVSIAGRVFDVTRLLAPSAGHGTLAAPLLEAAGQDISHWFEPGGREVKTYIDPVTNLRSPYLPMGRFVHVPPLEPTTAWAPDWELPWWQDDAYVVGTLSAAPRRVRIVNTLTGHEHVLDVGGEQSIAQIADKYLEFNAHALGYAWKVLAPDGSGFMECDMGTTLAGNGVPDDSAELEQLGLDEAALDMLPALMLYYKDELTVA